MHATELIKDYHKQKLATVKNIRRMVVGTNINMPPSTPPFTLGYTWDQLCLATVNLDDCQKKAALKAKAYFFDLTKEHRKPGQPNTVTYEQV
jgi:hypothetical protein